MGAETRFNSTRTVGSGESRESQESPFCWHRHL